MGRKNRRKISAEYKNLGFNPDKYIVKQNNGEEKSQDTGGNVRFEELGKHPGTSAQEGCRPVFIV